MNISVHLALLVAVCLCVAEAAPDGRYARKQQRPTRGFKNVEMMTARGFGKRARAEPCDHGQCNLVETSDKKGDVEHQAPSERSNRGTPTFKSPSVGIARDFGKRSPELDSEDEPPRRKFHINGPLMVAKDFGKRSGNDDYNEEEEVIRAIRGAFKPNSNILIARGYGKRQEEPRGEEEIRVTRGTFNPHSNVLIARGFGKRQSEEEVYGLDNFWENLEAAQEKDGQDGSDDKTIESIPMDWFVNEMINNADFARSVVRKFIDLNQDGILSSEELLRNI